MGSSQLEARIATVIKSDPAPAIGTVAAFAARREATGMNVILGMTGRADSCSILEGGRLVARFAGHGDVQPKQWKVRNAMIKFHILTPGCDTMAIAALIAELTLVNILCLMAINTGHGDLVLRVGAMAIATLRLSMGT